VLCIDEPAIFVHHVSHFFQCYVTIFIAAADFGDQLLISYSEKLITDRATAGIKITQQAILKFVAQGDMTYRLV